MQALNYSNVFAANVAAGYMAALAVGKFSLGRSATGSAPPRACALALVSLLTAFIAMIFAGFLPIVPLLILSSGLEIRSARWRTRSSPVRSTASATTQPSRASSPPSTASAQPSDPAVCGAIFDASGSYTPGYIVMAGFVAVFGGRFCWRWVEGGTGNAGCSVPGPPLKGRRPSGIPYWGEMIAMCDCSSWSRSD